ncbi:golgi protein 1, putative [Plasmodium yoelii]|uniref:Golgi protein 1 n=3 Tax=Plasmodium yoelii TaxID=5861 RepID=A0AAE9WV40_PLAYO|nr:golgi protein 1, putative [Plasmodium yoelii]WBY60776.1 golgi protein 1 [Plasmodium yoelii yoelii]CDU20553.1 rhoptry protein 2, putative [Plasmodium yoelii]VTZ81514.1 golgi protein 1, putative [Plasmodium yoelii]|eukprot:XP_724089.2 golgi protein 1, putative [Plasmodium yoelii]
MISSKSIILLTLFTFICNTSEIYTFKNDCDFKFNVKLLNDVYDKYNGEPINGYENNENYCTNLESLNPIKSFWALKLKSLCTEETSILDKEVFVNVCSKQYSSPHVTINDISLENKTTNIEFVCAHFLYNNNKEIIKCIKHKVLGNYLDSYHIAFDLSMPHELLKQSNHIEDVLNFKDLENFPIVKRIVDDATCRIHSSIHIIMDKHDFYLLKSLIGLCTKLGFHTQFIITDNIHPLLYPLFKDISYSLSSLNFAIQNSIIFYTRYEYYLYNLKISDIDHVLGSYISPSSLVLNQHNSYVTWLGLDKDNDIYMKKFNELYKIVGEAQYIERIIHCYSKYTSKYYEESIKYFLKYIPENKRDSMKNNPKIFIYIINGLCKDIPSVHQCAKKIISLESIYDLYFKNFMINFLYYNVACIFNCSGPNIGNIINDEELWDVLVEYFSNSYLVNYKKTKNTNIINRITGATTISDQKEDQSSEEYKQLANAFYNNYDYDYLYSAKWKNELKLDDELSIFTPSDEAIEYEFYNYTFQSLDLGSYVFFILKNEVEEDNICIMSSFIEENGKKYSRTNKYISDIFNKNNKRLLSYESNGNEDGLNNNDEENGGDENSGDGNGGDENGGDENGGDENGGEENGGDENSDDEIDDEENGSGENGEDSGNNLSNFNIFDDLLGGKNGNSFMDLFQNNKIFDHLYNHNDEDEDDEEDESNSDPGEVYDEEKYKIETDNGYVYPLRKEYTLNELQEVHKEDPSANEFDSKIRRHFFNSKLSGKEVFFTVKDVPSKIKNLYKYYYEIKKKSDKFNKVDEEKYNSLIELSKSDPDVFSKVNIEFVCTKTGKWPIRGVSGRWLSDVLCEAKFVPQLIYNHEYADKNKANGNISGSGELDTNLYSLKKDTRLIGIEFETHKPHRCAISYLADEGQKTLIPVSAMDLIKAAVGYCMLHGFKTIWLADSAFDINTNIYLRYTSILEHGITYYEQSGFEIYNQTRLIPKLEYIASGMNIENNTIVSGTYKNKYNLISFPGTDLSFHLLMSKKVKNIIHNLKFDCHDWAFNGCGEYYILMNKHPLKKYKDNKYDTIILDREYSQEEKEKMYQCAFMHDRTFIELNKMFPKECTYNSRIGDCHKKVRKNIPCYDSHSCRYLIYLYNYFYKPQNHKNLLNEHFIKVSENLTRLARPYYLQSILSLEHDINIKKSKKQDTSYEDIALFILKNSIFYVTWVTSSEYWKRSMFVQDNNPFTTSIESYDVKKELFCPVAYSHEYVGHMLVQFMKFPKN